MITQTTIDSYIATKREGKVGKRHREILELLALTVIPFNNRQIAERLGLPINSITGRMFELRDMGKVVSAGVSHDEVTNRDTMMWRLK